MRLKHGQQRRGHRETPFIVGFVVLACTLGNGLFTVARDAQRAKLAGSTLNLAARGLAFGHGFLWGLLLFVALIVALLPFIFGDLLESWKRKRRKSRHDR